MDESGTRLGQQTRFEVMVAAVTVVTLRLVLAGLFAFMLTRPLDAAFVGCVGLGEATVGLWLTEAVLR